MSNIILYEMRFSIKEPEKRDFRGSNLYYALAKTKNHPGWCQTIKG